MLAIFHVRFNHLLLQQFFDIVINIRLGRLRIGFCSNNLANLLIPLISNSVIFKSELILSVRNIIYGYFAMSDDFQDVVFIMLN